LGFCSYSSTSKSGKFHKGKNKQVEVHVNGVNYSQLIFLDGLPEPDVDISNKFSDGSRFFSLP